MPSAHAGMGGGGVRLNVTRKYFAVTGAKEMVCSGALPSREFRDRAEVLPVVAGFKILLGRRHPCNHVFDEARILRDEGDRANGLAAVGIHTESRRLSPAGRNRQLGRLFEVAVGQHD